MDILDIMLARALTPQGQTETYVGIANAAAEKAEKAKQDAAEAIATVEAAADEIAAAQEEASDLLEAAQEALTTAQAAQINTLDIEDVDEEIKKMKVTRSQVTTNASEYYENLHVTYPDGTGYVLPGTVMLQKKTGTSEVAGMTQKAITEALATKADTSYVANAIANIPIGTGSNQFNSGDAGHMVVIDENGNATASDITEEALLESLSDSDVIVAKDAVGLDMNYASKTFIRIQKSANLSMGSNFDKFIMYGGRRRCNVSDNGAITAFYGDGNYRDDGSNGQVMVYQPKFYYKRIPYEVDEKTSGNAIRHEALLLSATEQIGFKLAPIFYDGIEYMLLPAYNGSLVDDKLASIAGATPLTNINIVQAEEYAQNRGNGWHILNMAAIATNQMLEIVEFGMMNGQTALEQGIVTSPSSSGSYTFINGSTSILGNASGHAEETQVNINNSIVTQTVAGKRAISYRGMENPWGNLWQMIGGINIYGDGRSNGGTPFICTDFNYDTSAVGNNYESVGFNLPTAYKWQNAMGLGNTKYDWVFLPIECTETANSLLPIGDSIWYTNNLSGLNIIANGGSCGFAEECGPFYYAADRKPSESARANYNAKLMYIPTKNSVYNANIAKWTAHVGG